MPKSVTWPGGVAMEPLTNIDSAGSCDSVISMTSGYSEGSMEHLSAEERACLMYLEETIEALEVQEDSGLSNDEPEEMSRTGINDVSGLKSESRSDQKSDKAEHVADNELSEAQSSSASAPDSKPLDTSATQQKPPVPGSKIHPSAPKPEMFLSKDEDGKIKIVSSTSRPTPASEMDLDWIPPPSDFMDEPGLPPEPEKAKDLLPSTGTSSNKPGATVDLEELRQRALSSVSPPEAQEPPDKSPEPLAISPGPQMSPPHEAVDLEELRQRALSSVSSPEAQKPPKKSPEPLAISPGPQMSPPHEAFEPRSPPVVAPRPKKLPANIILKSHKAAGADGNLGHSVPSSTDRLLLDPQRVRIEALRKLGLLKSEEADSGPILSPRLSPQSRRSWAAPSSPISPAAPHTPPMTPSYTRLHSPSPASIPPPAPAAEPPSDPAVQPPGIVPAPAAFSDPDEALLPDDELSAVKDARVDTPPGTPPALVKQLTPNRLKSATLERSGLGLSSHVGSQSTSEAAKQSPSQLRNSRPRPASLGSGKEFAQGEGSHVGHATSKEPDLRRSLPAFQHAGDSQKLPRSQGISVLICPRTENGENRREALKRLGLFRD